jgi:hypothetical protein
MEMTIEKLAERVSLLEQMLERAAGMMGGASIGVEGLLRSSAESRDDIGAMRTTLEGITDRVSAVESLTGRLVRVENDMGGLFQALQLIGKRLDILDEGMLKAGEVLLAAGANDQKLFGAVKGIQIRLGIGDPVN